MGLLIWNELSNQIKMRNVRQNVDRRADQLRPPRVTNNYNRNEINRKHKNRWAWNPAIGLEPWDGAVCFVSSMPTTSIFDQYQSDDFISVWWCVKLYSLTHSCRIIKYQYRFVALAQHFWTQVLLLLLLPCTSSVYFLSWYGDSADVNALV